MEVTVEEKGVYDRTITVRIPAEEVNTALNEEVGKLAKTVRIPGFRPGKTPKGVVESRYKPELSVEVADKLVNGSFVSALQETKLTPVSRPTVELEEVARDKEFVYHAKIQIFPEVDPQGYEGITLTRRSAEITDQDAQEVEEGILDRNSEYVEEADAKAQNDDQVLLDFEGFVDDEPFAGGKSAENGYQLVLGSNTFIPGFEDQLIGCAAGEDKDVTVSFPDNYHNDDLAGKEALFKCKIRSISRKVKAEMTDALAEKLGIQEGGVDELRNMIRKQLEQQADDEQKKLVKQQILDALLKANAMELPSQLVDHEIEGMVERSKNDLKGRGQDPDKLGLTDEQWGAQFKDTANERVLLGLVIGAIARKEKIATEEADIDAYLDDLEERVGQSIKKWVKENKEQLDEIKGTVLEQKVMDFIVSKADLTEESVSYKELMAPPPAPEEDAEKAE
ncbi:MAG: trigger factor [Magnetococcales bacterium]|nr:trigger factor [Magnetococcales bacterium]